MGYKYVIVLGMHRSGTTAVTKFLQSNGVYMGPLKDPNAESRIFAFDLVFFLNYLGGIWDMPYYIRRAYNTAYKNAKWTFLNRISKKLYIQSKVARCLGYKLVGFKHPIASLLFEELSEIENTCIILCRRKSEEIVRSLGKRVTPKMNRVIGAQYPFGQYHDSQEKMRRLAEFYHSLEDTYLDKIDFIINYEELVDENHVEDIFERLGKILNVKFRGAKEYFKRQG